MHHDELWQEYNKNGTPIMNGGRPSAFGNKSGNDGVYYGATIIWLYRRTGDGGIEILFQKRSQSVDRFPGKWDISAGGHVNYQETTQQGAIRELGEEIGVKDITEQELDYVVGFKGEIGIYHIYVVDYTGHEDNFNFDDGEVEEVRWVPLEEFHDFRKKYGKEPLAEDDNIAEIIAKYLRQYGNSAR